MATRETVVGGFRWVLKSGFPSDSPPLLKDLSSGRIPPGFRVIRSNPRRIILRGRIGEAGLFVKRHMARGFAGRALTLFAPSPSKREWDASALLSQRCVPTPEALAFSELREFGSAAESIVVFEEIAGSSPAIDAQWRNRPDSGRFCRELGRFVRKIHEADVFHPDLHLGNVLAREGADGFELFLVDLHSLRPICGPGESGIIENLAHVRNSLGEDGKEFEAFLSGYFEKGGIAGLSMQRAAEESSARAGILRIRRYASRTAKALKESGSFEVLDDGDLRVFHRRGSDPQAAVRAFRSFESRGTAVLKSGHSVQIRSGFDLGGTPAVGKMFTPSGFTQIAKALFGRGRGRRSYLNGIGLEVRGLSAARPLALVVSSVPAISPRSAVFMEDLTSFSGADRLVASVLNGDRKDLRLLARQLGEAIAAFHRRGVYPDDLKACNVMARKSGCGYEFKLVDHDGVAFPDRVSRRLMVRNLCQLNNSVPAALSRADRMRFLRSYSACFAGLGDADARDLFRQVWERSRGKGILWVSPEGKDVFEEFRARRILEEKG